ncbi:hypothetical protein FW415_13320 [Chitinophaga sp. XS-30]|nr:hypothetical protein FW415_13320 [Chitinophaga sp. XS-30]
MTTPSDSPYKYLQFKGQESYRRYIQGGITKNSPPGKPNENGSLNVKSHGSYGGLLFHPNWKAKRKEVLTRDMNRCVHCSSNKDLQVHHRQYHFIASQQKFRLPWEYPNHLLITLCECCHSKGHNKYKVPTITI